MNDSAGILIMLIFLIPFLILVALIVAGMWKIFQKAGYEGWEAIVPVYNLYILTKIVGKPGYWTVLMMIPYLGMIWSIWAYNMLAKSFGKDEAYTVGLVFLSFVFFPILGFGEAKYLGPYGDPVAFQNYGGKNQFEFEGQNQLPQ